MSDGAPLIDAAVFDETAEAIGLDALRAVIDLFLGECRTFLEVIAAGRREPARRAAHSLKSSAGQLGAAALAEAATAVERAAEEGRLLASPATHLAAVAEATIAALTDRLQAA